MNKSNEIDIKKVQSKILEIIVYIDKLCKEHKIDYYLMGGSALGAVRHKGFIPWDDDLDIFMTASNYFRFIEVCKTYLDKEKYYLQEEDTSEWPMFFSKLRLNNTIFLEEDTKSRKMHQGFYVDIMCLNNTVANKLTRYTQYICARILTTKTLSERGYITSNKVKILSMFLAKKIIRTRIERWLLNKVREFNNKDTVMVGHFFGRAKFKNTSFDIRILGTPKYVEFEKILLPVPEKVEEYLSIRFGKEFMDIPSSKTKRSYPVHAVYVDFGKEGEQQ